MTTIRLILAILLLAADLPLLAAELHGEVKDVHDHPVAGAVVALNPAAGKALVATTDERGAFTFAQAPGGAFGATASTPDQGAAFVPDIVLPRDAPLVLRLSGTGPVIEGHVRSPASTALGDAGLDLYAARVSDAAGDIFHGAVRGGRFALSLPAGSYVVFAKAPGFSAQSGIVALSDRTALDLFLVREVGANPLLAAELLRMEQGDQDARKRDLSDPAVQADIARLDKANGTRLRAILADGGWPKADFVGYQAEQAAWLLLQHDAVDLIPSLMPELDKAAAQGEISKGSLALSIDRSLTASGRRQRYGSQFKKDAQGRWQPEPIEDEANVDVRRREMGMEPLADYRKRFEDAMSAAAASGRR